MSKQTAAPQAEKKTNIKSTAKANGLKSTFRVNKNKLYMTSFGRGAEAVAEKLIENEEVTDLKNTFQASTEHARKEILVEGRTRCSSLVAPPPEEDLLHAREAIEKIFFGRTFEDNIHIQIAYSIMDVQKILAAYVAIAVQAIDHMERGAVDVPDFLGTFKTQNSYELSQSISDAVRLKLFTKRDDGKDGMKVLPVIWNSYKGKELYPLSVAANQYAAEQHRAFKIGDVAKYLADQGIKNLKILDQAADNWDVFQRFCKSAQKTSIYFGHAFLNDEGLFDKRKAFDLLRVLGELRQCTMHGSSFDHNRIYRADEQWDKDMVTAATQSLDRRINALNEDFCQSNRVNLNILREIYPKEDLKTLVQEYYDFSVRKAFKNLGFSVRTLRETMLTESAPDLREQKYDSVRSKLYSLFDFVIYRFYLEHGKEQNDIIEKLRAAISDEKKENIYKTTAQSLWKIIHGIVMQKIVPQLEADAIKSLQDTAAPDVDIMDYMQQPEQFSMFSRAIYALTMFLDGKEINMLLCDLTGKFENIGSFLQTIQTREDILDVPLNPGFAIFESSRRLAEELRFIRTVARMSKGKKAKKNSDLNIKEIQYLDSAAVFGETDAEKVKGLYHLGEKPQKGVTPDNSLRNFMINNVIQNNRFAYVVRFMNPEEAAKLMQSEPLVKFTLGEVPESQLIRYCRSVDIPYQEDKPEQMVSDLSERLRKVRFDEFRSVRQKAAANSAEAREKEKSKAVVSLYLTVLYQIVKTLVRINARYMIAFGILERDLQIYQKKTGSDTKKTGNKFSGQALLTQHFADEKLLNRRVKRSIDNNRKYYRDDTFRVFRNKVDHLEVIKYLPAYAPKLKRVESMFDVYHCVIFYAIAQEKGQKMDEEVRQTGLANMETYNTVWKDFLYGLMRPFAYNAARYINLSNREKFLESYGK